MKSIEKTVLIWFSAPEMMDLVADVARYPEFLPWCDRAEVVQTHPDGLTARVGLNFGGVRQSFSTRNTENRPGNAQATLALSLDLIDGPFSALCGQWQFQPVGTPETRACRVSLNLRYAFASAALAAVVGPVFDKIASSLVDAFVDRAQAVYAP